MKGDKKASEKFLQFVSHFWPVEVALAALEGNWSCAIVEELLWRLLTDQADS